MNTKLEVLNAYISSGWGYDKTLDEILVELQKIVDWLEDGSEDRPDRDG